jgi:hypothetical protein
MGQPAQLLQQRMENPEPVPPAIPAAPPAAPPPTPAAGRESYHASFQVGDRSPAAE